MKPVAKKPVAKPAPKPMSESAKHIRDRQEYEKMADGNVRRGGKK